MAKKKKEEVKEEVKEDIEKEPVHKVNHVIITDTPYHKLDVYHQPFHKSRKLWRYPKNRFPLKLVPVFDLIGEGSIFVYSDGTQWVRVYDGENDLLGYVDLNSCSYRFEYPDKVTPYRSFYFVEDNDKDAK